LQLKEKVENKKIVAKQQVDKAGGPLQGTEHVVSTDAQNVIWFSPSLLPSLRGNSRIDEIIHMSTHTHRAR
jgi:hypothetical protein